MSSGTPAHLMNLNAFLLPISEATEDKTLLQPVFFQFFPKVTGDQEQANYEDIGGDIIGRAEPFSIYKNGSAREFTIETSFAAVDETYDEFWVQHQVQRLKALTKPLYDREKIYNNTGRFFAPPLVIFTMGAQYINIPVVIKSVSAENHENSLITAADGLPQVVNVTITVKTNYPYGWVPGYINYVNLYSSDKLVLDASQMSYGPSTSTLPGDVKTILDDAARPTIPFNEANRRDAITDNTDLTAVQEV